MSKPRRSGVPALSAARRRFLSGMLRSGFSLAAANALGDMPQARLCVGRGHLSTDATEHHGRQAARGGAALRRSTATAETF